MESDDVLARIEARLARLEGALDRVTTALDQISPNVAMAADIADDWVAHNVGGDGVEARLPALSDAVVRLTDPGVLGALTRLAEMAPQLERVAGLAAGFDDHVGMAADIADDWVRRKVGGDGLEARLAAVEDAVVRLSAPEVVGALTRLAEKAPQLERVAELAAGFDDHVAMAADIADDWVREKVGGDGLEARLQAGGDALVKLSDPAIVGALVRLAEQAPRLESLASIAASFDDHVAMSADIFDAWIRDNIGGDGLEDLIGASRRLLDPEVLSAYVDIVRLAPNLMRTARVAADLDGFVDTMSQSLREEAAPVGFWGLVTALSDPEIQRGVGRVLLITRHLGRDTKLVPAIRS